ncbi:MAG: metallophosphoesterase [Salibacteraceae bacterium]
MLVFTVVALVLIVLDWYIYSGLKIAISPLPNWAQKTSKALFFGLTGLTILGFMLFEPMSRNQTTRNILTFIVTIGSANMIGKLVFALWIVLADIKQLAEYVWQKVNPPVNSAVSEGITRSAFLSQAGAITATLPLLGMGWGVLSGAHDYRIIRRTLKIKGLPQEFDGFSITQLSDLHSGSFWNRKAVKRGIKLANDQNSDVIFFTGDIVNNMARELEDWVDVFATLRAKHGVYSVLGNHDYGDYVAWSTEAEKKENLAKLIQMQRDMGWRLLMDEHEILTGNGAELAIVGIQNWGAKGRFPKYGDLSKAVKGVKDDTTQLLLSHDPSHWREQVLKDFPAINAMFSGHTHGFQFGIEVGSVKWSPVKYFYPEWADLYSEGDQFLYVNRGFGYIGYPGRLGIRPEITVITLSKA